MRSPASHPPKHPAVTKALQDFRRAFWGLAVFSGIVNLLMLAGPIYMLQIYDRVLGSRSVPTLIALSAFLVGAYVFQGVLDAIRVSILVRVASLLDIRLSDSVHAAVVSLSLQDAGPNVALQPVRDLDQIRTFFTGTGPLAIVDLPWVPIFLAICWLIHPWLGMLALGGGAILFILTILTEQASRRPSREMSQHLGTRTALVEADRRNSETVRALGMSEIMSQRWMRANGKYLASSRRMSDVAGIYGTASKQVRMLLQSVILGLGAYLVIKQELTGGAMIASSIMVGRALAPIEIAISNWRTFVSARISVRRLSETLARVAKQPSLTALPAPWRELSVDQVAVFAPGVQKALVSGISFDLAAGEALGIIGPSGGGKTSLVRCLVGARPVSLGTVRLDGATIEQWEPGALGRHIGFLSQSVELFDGTIAQNIARMADDASSEAIIRAAHVAQAHDLILKMPNGYNTEIGEGGAALSAGQRQRIALARALYGDPFLIVLDEPNSNLDAEGELALAQAIRDAKARGAVVIIVAHRTSMLSICDKVLMISGGQQKAFGPRDEVMRKLFPVLQSAPGNGPHPIRAPISGIK